MVIVLIGPMGCGKTTVGRLLAQQLSWPFDDADDFHPPANVAKMRAGTPLTDEDRHGWLQVLAGRIAERLTNGENLVLACSALKTRYREILGVDQRRVVTVYLKGEKALLAKRIAARNHPFMNDSLLASQLATMEEPQGGLHLDIAQPPENLVAAIIAWLNTETFTATPERQIMTTTSQHARPLASIGIAGLAVMGENLVLNIADKGFSVAVYNRTGAKVDAFVAGRGAGKAISGYHDVKAFVAGLERPRKVMMMLKAGSPVDEFIDQILPHLDKGDIVIDGGNSHYDDTMRRSRRLEDVGLYFIGTGVSGGEEGALKGPSIMPGGSPSAWPQVEKIFTAIAAKAGDGEPCCSWMGPDGAGHFVKMVHNGIEYGDMQLICEAYQVMRVLLGLGADQLHEVFARWNRGDLQKLSH
jgi:6-phosphogluconate dehydrogenase